LKKLFIFFFFHSLIFADLLNDLKLNQFKYDERKILQESRETKKSWINPVILQYSFTQNDSLNVITKNRVFTISINQPVFKSGAIYYSIKYAKHSKLYNKLNLELQKRELIKKALELAFDYKINKLNEKIILLNIKNAKIDIKKKKEDFLNGIGDSTLLNNAVLNLNTLMLNLEDMKIKNDSLKYSFANISSLDIEKLKLPEFKILNKKNYIKRNIEYNKQNVYKQVKKDLYKMQIGNQLLSVNLNASYNWQNTDYSPNTAAFKDYSNDYYQIGFNIVWPISFNALNKIEKNKIDYLKSSLLIIDKKNELENRYESIIRQINGIDKKILIYKENIKIYDNLINSTIESIHAGNATEYDLELLKNSRETMYLNIKMLQLQKDKILLNMYYDLTGWNWGVHGKN